MIIEKPLKAERWPAPACVQPAVSWWQLHSPGGQPPGAESEGLEEETHGVKVRIPRQSWNIVRFVLGKPHPHPTVEVCGLPLPAQAHLSEVTLTETRRCGSSDSSPYRGQHGYPCCNWTQRAPVLPSWQVFGFGSHVWVLVLVICTVQQPLHRAPSDTDEIIFIVCWAVIFMSTVSSTCGRQEGQHQMALVGIQVLHLLPQWLGKATSSPWLSFLSCKIGMVIPHSYQVAVQSENS